MSEFAVVGALIDSVNVFEVSRFDGSKCVVMTYCFGDSKLPLELTSNFLVSTGS